jgi:hypothetical protein
MLKFDAANSECSVFTYKQGWLSAVAHDLKLTVSQFEIAIQVSHQGNRLSVQDIGIEAVFDAASLRMVCAIKDGCELPGGIKPSDYRDIEQNIKDVVLRSKQFHHVWFSSTDVSGDIDRLEIKGTVTLCGVTRMIVFPALRYKAGYMADVILNQPDFGIKPFSALLGSMKVKPKIKVRMIVPFSFKGTI